MTDNNIKGGEGPSPAKAETLLPWLATGKLGLEDIRQVEDALANDPVLASRYGIVQDEQAETILLNESLGAPSSRAMEKLFAAIDAEPERKPSADPVRWLGSLFRSLSPRALAWSAIAGACLLLLQAGVIGTVLVKRGPGFQTASYEEGVGGTAGSKLLVSFKQATTLTDLTVFLVAYHGSIVAGPQSGMFTIRFGDKPLSQQDLEALIAKVKAETIVSFAAATP